MLEARTTQRTVCGLLLAIVGIIAIASCSEIASPTRQVPAVEHNNFNQPAFGSMFDCETFTFGSEWTCDSTWGEQFSQLDYLPWWEFTSPNNCVYNPAYCPSSTYYATGGTYGLTPVTPSDSDAIGLVQPNCPPNPVGMRPRDYVGAYAWCNGAEPQPFQVARIINAKNLMKAISDTCAALAAAVDSELKYHQLRVYIPDSVVKGGISFTPFGAGPTGPYSYSAIWIQWTDVKYDYAHRDGAGIDLQEILAHEMDHLLGHAVNGNPHIDAKNFFTPNSQRCGGLT